MWDYIIIGAGSSGCVLANRLSASGKHNVLLLEAGGSDRNPIYRIPPAGSFLCIRNPKRDWNYRTLPDPSRNGRTELWPRGKMLGGSSSINGMIYVRGDQDDYNHWAQLGNRGWSFDDVEAHFKAIESYSFEKEGYGSNGPMKVKQIQGAHRLSHVFVDACAEIGIPKNDHYNLSDQEGACILHVTQSKRVRHSAAQAFLQPARNRSNLEIIVHAHATKIIFEGRKAVGVEYTKGGKRIKETVRREIILSGGSINSPQLLMLSGIGPEEHLREHGVEVVCDLSGVGQNLHEHPGLMMQAEVSVKTPNVEINPFAAAKYGAQWLMNGKGPLTSVVFQALAFANTASAGSHPDIQINFAPMGYGADDKNVRLLDFPSITLQPNVNRPRSRGALSLSSVSPFDPPAIQANMLGDEYDLNTLVEAGKLCRSLYQTKAFKPLIKKELLPTNDVQTDADWAAFAKEFCIPAFHPVGTCKMGADDMAVVTPELKVRGVEGLRVIDASIMPQVVSGNINAACLMIGEKGADMILQETVHAQ